MTRISTHGTSQLYLSYITRVQADSQKAQIQVASGLKAPNYSGISRDTNLLLNYEHEIGTVEQYVANSNTAGTRLDVAGVTLSAVEKTMQDFRDRLQNFRSAITDDPNQVQELQNWAFKSMKDLYSYMLADVNGQYIFGGARTDTEPVKFPYESIDAFQAKYDGTYTTFPTTRAAHLFETDLDTTETGQVTFDAAAGTMQSDGTAFDNIPAGTTITLGGTNEGTYTVTANDGNSPALLTLSPKPNITAAAVTDVTVTAESYYHGDTTNISV